MSIDAIIDRTVAVEGGYSNHPADRGGPTRYGITEEVARAYGFAGDMRVLPRSEALRIYKEKYWLRVGFDKVEAIYPKLAEEMFDTGVNMGERQPIYMLQRSLNALNRQGRDYGDLKPDGDCGPLTLQNLAKFKAVRGSEGEAVLLKALNCIQGERYLRITESRPANEAFTYGWLANRVSL